MTRNSIILSGLAGVVGAMLLTGFCLLVMSSGYIPALLTQPVVVWTMFLFLLFFSVAEIPVMVFGISRIAESANPKAIYMALFTNAGFTFFAAVYAAPFILLTGGSTLILIAGTLLAMLSLARFIVAVLYLSRHAKQP